MSAKLKWSHLAPSTSLSNESDGLLLFRQISAQQVEPFKHLLRRQSRLHVMRQQARAFGAAGFFTYTAIFRCAARFTRAWAACSRFTAVA